MKALALGIVTIGLVMFLSSVGKAQDESLILYCPFEEGGGDKTEDMTGKNKPGTLNGGIKWVDGKYGGALSFNGTDAFVEIPDNDILDPENITVEMWLNPNDWASQPVLVLHSDNQSGWYVQMWTAAGNGTFCVPEPGADHCHTSPSVTFEKGKFQHLAVTYDQKEINFYLNGELRDTMPESTPITDYDGSMIFGKWSEGGYFYNGILDEVAIYSRLLTREEIKKDMSKGILMAVETSGKLATTWSSIKVKY